MGINIGIDLGSISVKAALFSKDPADVPFFEQHAGHRLFNLVRRLPTGSSGYCWVATTQYSRIAGSPIGQTRGLLEQLLALIDRDSLGGVAVTGRGAALVAEEFGLTPENEFRALAKAVELLLPRVRTLFEMGGETSKYSASRSTGPTATSASWTTRQTATARQARAAFSISRRRGLRFTVDQIGDIVALDSEGSTDRRAMFGLRQERHDPRAAEGLQPRGDLEGALRRGGAQLQERHHQGQNDSRRCLPSLAEWPPTAASCRRWSRRSAGSRGSCSCREDFASFSAIGAALLSAERTAGRSTKGAKHLRPRPCAPPMAVASPQLAATFDGQGRSAPRPDDGRSARTDNRRARCVPRDRHRLGQHQPGGDRRELQRAEGDLPADRGAPDRGGRPRPVGDPARSGIGRIRVRGVGTTGSGASS
jgi:hypothetical protein